MWKLHGTFNCDSGQLVLQQYDSMHVASYGDRVIHCAFSGRLLNHPNSRSASRVEEAELLVAAYLECPDLDFLNNWAGDFCYVIHDSVDGSLLIGADSYGTFPLFYRQDGPRFSFSSEYEELLSDYRNAFDVHAIAEFLTFGTVLGTKTFIEGVSSIRSGRVVVLSSRGIEERRIPGPTFKSTTTFSELAAEVVGAISASVNDHVALYGESLKVDLSGGLDTRLIASCIARDQLRINGFQTCYTPPLDEHTDQDVILGKAIASQIGYPIRVDPMPISGKMDSFEFLRTFSAFEPSATLKGVMGGELLNADSVRFIPEHLLSLLRLLEAGAGPSELRQHPSYLLLHEESVQNQLAVEKAFGSRPVLAVDSLLDEFTTYQEEANPIMWFALQYFMRSFICDIYCDSSFIWMTPHKFLTKACAPFLDKRVLDIILKCSPQEVRGATGYRLYSEIYKTWFPKSTGVLTNSLIGRVTDSGFRISGHGMDRKSLMPKTLFYDQYWSQQMRRLSSESFQNGAINSKRHGILDGWIRYRELRL